MTKQLCLYSTSYCHLCELAYSLAMKIPDISVVVIDIEDDDFLFEKFGIRIPVLLRQDTKTELNWPFNEADIQKLLE